MAKTMTVMLSTFLASTGRHSPVNQNPLITPINNDMSFDPTPSTLRSERFYCKEASTTLLELSKKAFSTALSKDKWAELLQDYLTI